MKIRLMSDLHLHHHKDHGDAFQESVSPLDQDEVLVLAGDIIDTALNPGVVRKRVGNFASKWRKVILVRGNHEYYLGSPKVVDLAFKEGCKGFSNVHVLDNNFVEIEGVRFLGGTGWFPYDPSNAAYERGFSDFEVIRDFNPWVYEQHMLFKAMLNGNLRKGDVVVSHHLPSYECVAKKFRTGVFKEYNRFFAASLDHIIEEKQPALWMCGHTHEPFDLTLAGCRIVANPLGYPRERKPPFNERLVIEV